MANASAKRIGTWVHFLVHISQLTHSLTASQNETAIKNLLYGHLLGNLLPLLIRVLFRWQGFRQSKMAIVLYCISAALSQFLHQHLKRTGTPRRDSTGGLVSPGDDLNQPGMMEWTFDILYICCELINRRHIGIRPLIGCRVCPSRLCHSRRMVLVDIRCGMTYLISCDCLLDACPQDSCICDLQIMERSHLTYATRPFVFRRRRRTKEGRLE